MRQDGWREIERPQIYTVRANIRVLQHPERSVFTKLDYLPAALSSLTFSGDTLSVFSAKADLIRLGYSTISAFLSLD